VVELPLPELQPDVPPPPPVSKHGVGGFLFMWGRRFRLPTIFFKAC
jgi:hypothetical protein